MRTKYILLTILSSLVFASCNYLDFDETNNLKTKEDMYKYFGTSKSMLTHVYSYMPQGYQLFATSGGLFTEDRYSMRDCASDDGEFGAYADNIQNTNNGNWSPIKTYDDSWTLYRGIRAANSFIAEIAQVDFTRYEHDGQYTNWMKQLKYFPYEARVLRAHYFFELARRYGDIAMPLEVLTEEEANSVTHLTLTGKLNAEDFRHLRDEFDNLKVLDISNAEIKMYSGKAGTYPNGKFYIYMPNFIPAYAFSNVVDGVTKGKATLEKVILSEKTKNIEDAAFKGCENLKICQIRKKTAPNLLPEALADSVTAIFVPLGSSDSYRYKDRWQNFAFIEGEPVETTLQVGAMGKLEEEILKAGLQPRDINFLTVEGKLDNADFKLIRDYMPNLVSVDISRTNATAIPDFTFAQKKYLLNMKLPHNLKSIGQRVFSNCGRLCGTLELPASVTAIEFGAFMGCDNLRYVLATGNKITTLGDNLFGEGVPSKLVYKK